jgi:hypothetical protein
MNLLLKDIRTTYSKKNAPESIHMPDVDACIMANNVNIGTDVSLGNRKIISIYY